MNEQLVIRLMSKQFKTIDDIKNILDFIVVDMRSSLDINNIDTRLCKECSISLINVCNKLGIPYIPFSMSEIGMEELEHHYGITGFNTEFGQICILLDLTYIQFNTSGYSVNLKNKLMDKQVLSPGNFISEKNKTMLVKSGYLTLTKENYDDYLRSFIETYKLLNPINEDLVYDIAYKNLEDFNINFSNKDYLNNKGITF